MNGSHDLYIYAISAMGLICIGLFTLFIRALWQTNKVFNSEPDFVLGDHPHIPEGTHGLTGKMGFQAGGGFVLPEHRNPGKHLPDKVEEAAPCGRSTRTTRA